MTYHADVLADRCQLAEDTARHRLSPRLAQDQRARAACRKSVAPDPLLSASSRACSVCDDRFYPDDLMPSDYRSALLPDGTVTYTCPACCDDGPPSEWELRGMGGW